MIHQSTIPLVSAAGLTSSSIFDKSRNDKMYSTAKTTAALIEHKPSPTKLRVPKHKGGSASKKSHFDNSPPPQSNNSVKRFETN